MEAFGIFFILIGCAAPIIVVSVVYYLKKRFEHKQIMTALEKGTPLSELRPPKQNGALWIRKLTLGVALIIIGLGWWWAGPRGPGMFVAVILCGLGLAWLIRGLLYRKYPSQSQPLAKTNAVKSQNSLDVSTPETVQQTDK